MVLLINSEGEMRDQKILREAKFFNQQVNHSVLEAIFSKREDLRTRHNQLEPPLLLFYRINTIFYSSCISLSFFSRSSLRHLLSFSRVTCLFSAAARLLSIFSCLLSILLLSCRSSLISFNISKKASLQ